jgi:hypothetical protein
VASGVATPAEAQASYNSTANRALASGASPAKAAAAAKQAMVQLGSANTRSGPATPSQRMGDSLASGKPVAGGAALGSALARGASPAAALAAAAAREARTNAMLAAAAVAQSAADQAVSSLAPGQPGSAAMAAALASGRDPAAALARAQAAAATLAAMQQAAAVPLTQSAQAAAGLATGNTGNLSAAALTALARTRSPAEAAAIAARAERERQEEISRSRTNATDPDGSALAAGSVPTGKTLVVRNGVPMLVPDNEAAQAAAASVPLAANDPGAALAAGRLPEGVTATPELSMAIARALRHGATLSDAIAQAVAARPRADGPGKETLASSLATGRIDKDTLTELAGGTDVNTFMKLLGNALQRGTALSDAIANALRNARASNPDHEVAKQ